MTTYHYNGLTSSVIGGAEGRSERRMLSWQQQEQLGRTTLLRSYTPGGGEWTLASEISLNYDAADRPTQVYRRDGCERRWQRTSSIGYDLLGRKTSMSDADYCKALISPSWRRLPRLLSFCHAVTYARLGKYVGGVSRIITQFASQFLDERADSP